MQRRKEGARVSPEGFVIVAVGRGVLPGPRSGRIPPLKAAWQAEGERRKSEGQAADTLSVLPHAAVC